MSWPCTWWEQTGREHRALCAECPCGHETREDLGLIAEDSVAWSDTARWPECCEACGHSFDYFDSDSVGRSATASAEFRCPATGAVALARDLPIGALFDCGFGRPRGGVHLVCVIPGEGHPTGTRTVDGVPVGVHHWHIDQRASNCGSPEDNEHFCWCRHGDPRKPETVHVDKACNTCAAGAGSIAVPGFHGFLHHGEVVQA